MTSILISSDDKNIEKKIAAKLAKSLGFQHLGLDFLKSVADDYKTTQEQLLKAMNIPPSLRCLFSKTTKLHLAYIQAAVLEQLLKDEIVCEGLAAHMYVRSVSHIMTIRLLSDKGGREEKLASQKSISQAKAKKEIEKENIKCTRWSKKLFNFNEEDASNYDMVLRLEQIEMSNALNIICDMVKYRKFKAMTYSNKCLEDIVLASKLRVLLLPKFPDFKVVANDGSIAVHIKCSKRQKAKTAGEIKVIANDIPNIKFVEVHTVNKLEDK